MNQSDFRNSDILARILMDSLKFTPIKFALAVLLISITYSLFLSFLAVNGIDYYFKNKALLVWAIIVWPVMAGFYLWGSQVMSRIIESITSSGVISLSAKDESFIESNYNNSSRQNISIFIALLLCIIYLSMIYTRDITNGEADLVLIIGQCVAYALGAYMLLMLFLTLIFNIQILNGIFKNKVLDMPFLNLSNGLGALSDYSLKTALLSALVALMIALFLYSYGNINLCEIELFDIPLPSKESIPEFICDIKLYHLMIYLGIPLYFIAALLCFFLPLYAAHQRMKEAKAELINSIANSFKDNYTITKNKLSDPRGFAESTENTKRIQDFYNLTETFQEWPFNLSTLRNFSLSVITTILAMISPVITEYLKGFLD